MKFKFLFAALAAVAVSAPPTRNTTLTEAALKKRSHCHTTTLRWSISVLVNGFYYHTFTFKVNYIDGETYSRQMFVQSRAEDTEKTTCYDDGVWCVKYSGWDESGKITIMYAHQQFAHRVPYLRTVTAGNFRDDFHYSNCVVW
ncbi:hypothetical protein BGW39_003178 [Mortierella sp. 14UC]|nr:hypothetical protein BGW39_003178 [Mortierella sp. 14UC]